MTAVGLLPAMARGLDADATVPVPCLGPLDQHSRLQLLMDERREYLVSIARTRWRALARA